MSMEELIMSLEIGLIYGIVAMGVYLTFRMIDFPDLTCDGSFVLGAAASSMMIKGGYNPFGALCVALGAGGIAGLTTGVLYTQFKVKDLLSGILVAFMLYSINLRVMHGVPNIALMDRDTVLMHGHALVILALISLMIASFLGYLLNTDWGLGLRAVGQNKRCAQNQGVKISTMIVLGLVLSNSLVALAGALFSQHQGFADVGSGVGTVTVALASVMIGECLLPFRSLWVGVVACLLGSVVYRVLISLALHIEGLGLESYDLNLITGLMVIGVMTIHRRSHAHSR